MTMILCSVDWSIRTSSLLWFSSSPPANRAKSIPNTFSMSAGLFQRPGVNDSNSLPATNYIIVLRWNGPYWNPKFEISIATGPPSQEAQSLSSPFRTTGGGSKGAGLAQWGPCLSSPRDMGYTIWGLPRTCGVFNGCTEKLQIFPKVSTSAMTYRCGRFILLWWSLARNLLDDWQLKFVDRYLCKHATCKCSAGQRSTCEPVGFGVLQGTRLEDSGAKSFWTGFCKTSHSGRSGSDSAWEVSRCSWHSRWRSP